MVTLFDETPLSKYCIICYTYGKVSTNGASPTGRIIECRALLIRNLKSGGIMKLKKITLSSGVSNKYKRKEARYVF